MRTRTMIVPLRQVDRGRVSLVGGKAAWLGEVTRIEGVQVPPGFCLTTEAFAEVVGDDPAVQRAIADLDRLNPDDQEEVRACSTTVRDLIRQVPVPEPLAARLRDELTDLGAQRAYAVRSSATAEDLPGASFAGQHDSFLEVVGPPAVLSRIRQCWASLFTHRAVTYRLRHGFAHHAVQMAVIVQHLVPAQAAGVLFTADPVTGRRTRQVIEAVAGLGEDLVSGRVSPQVYAVTDGAVQRETAAEHPAGDPPVLTDTEVQELAALGQRIQDHLGAPQDIEWCLAAGQFQVVQSRPITTVFPVPAADDNAPRVYLSVGHQQMMTDPMKPLGLSVWQLTSPAPMRVAGGRLFVDATARLTDPVGRPALLATMEQSDPLMADALHTVLQEGFLPLPEAAEPASPTQPPPAAEVPTDPAIVAELIDASQRSQRDLAERLQQVPGPEVFDVIVEDLDELRAVMMGRQSMPVIQAGMAAAQWLNEHLQDWLGEQQAADTLSLSAPHNVTAQMGLELLDVADVIRPYPEVVSYLRHEAGQDFLAALPSLPGGTAAQQAIEGFLSRYGMRCVGEVDITRPRWQEQPAALLPILLGQVDQLPAGEATRRFEGGRQRAETYAADLLDRLRALPDGAAKAEQTAAMIDRLRTFVGYREYPKYAMVSRYLSYKQALLRAVQPLVANGQLAAATDCFWLTFAEVREAVRTGEVPAGLVAQREAAFRGYAALRPPRVLTSEGTALLGSYRRSDDSAHVLPGLGVSAGVVQGRARVVQDLATAELAPGDILVTGFTDPSWTPAFVTIAGLVTEAGGMMTHGAVVAREYGLPAVVGVLGATDLIRDGQLLRVDGREGTVELLD